MTDFAWRYRKAVLTLVFLLTAIGIYCARVLPVAIFPQLTVPRIVVSADAGDLPVFTTLAQVTRPLEAAASTVWGVTRVASTTSRGSAEIDVTFAWGSDMQLALQRMQGKVAQARTVLPAGTNVRAVLINASVFPIMGISLTGLDPATLHTLAEYTVRPRLARLPGVAQIRVTGGDVPEFLVAVRPAALSARGLTMQDVENALAQANNIATVGHFPYAYHRYEVLVSGLLRNADDIRNVTIAVHGHAVPILVRDVAEVTRSVAPRTVLASSGGQPATVINVVRQPQANTIAVAQEVRKALRDMRSNLPPLLKTQVFYDQSQIVSESESSVVESIAVGGVLALVVLMGFLGNARAAAVVLSVLPLALLITLGFMRLMGQTLNIMTLGALAVALGLVIDDGIVVVENIFHELEHGASRREAVRSGVRGITAAMFGSSVTTMAAFMPLTLLSGVTGQFFTPLALVMIVTLAVSLVLSMVVAPILATWLLPKTRPKERKRGGFMDRLGGWYTQLLHLSLRHRLVVLGLLVPLLLLDFVVAKHLQTGFFPEFDEGAFVIDYHMPWGTSLTETNRAALEVEKLLGQTPEVAAWSRLTGARSGSGLELTEPSQGDILVRLKSRRERSADEIMSDVRRRIEAKIPAIHTDFAQIMQDGIGDIAGSPSPIEVKIFGNDMATLITLARKTQSIISKIPGVVEPSDGVVNSGPETIVQVNGPRAAHFGLTTDSVTSAAAAALNGIVSTWVQEGEQKVGVRVRAAGELERMSPDRLPDVRIAAPLAVASGAPDAGGTVPLRAVATLETNPGSTEIRRQNQQQMVAVTARLEGRDLGGGMADVQAALGKSLRLPPGYSIEYGGLYASQQESFAELGRVLALAVLLVAMLLMVWFRSFREMFALLAAALLSMSGVLLGLFVTGTPLDIASYTGAIMIVGIVTENGIVLFDFYNELRRQRLPGESAVAAMEEAGRMRLRPIMMTTVGAVLALFPLALGYGAGAAMQKPLAIAVIGGLSVSMAFTLVVAPVLLLSFGGGPVDDVD